MVWKRDGVGGGESYDGVAVLEGGGNKKRDGSCVWFLKRVC